MASFSSRSRSLQRTTYSNPPSRSGSRSRTETPSRSRSSSLEPTAFSFSKPISRATSLQSLPSSTFSSPFSSLPSRSAITPSLSRVKSASLTALSTPTSFSPTFSYKPQATFNTYNRYSTISSTPRTSLVDIRRPAISDRYQPYGVGRYGGAPAIVPSYSRYQRSSSPAPALKYFGPTQYLSSYANQQGVGSYTKLLRYSFASGANRSDRSSDIKPAVVTRSSYFEPGRYSSTYRSAGSNYGRSDENSRSTYGGSFNRSDADSTDFYKTRFRPTGAMSKYWTSPRKLFSGREID